MALLLSNLGFLGTGSGRVCNDRDTYDKIFRSIERKDFWCIGGCCVAIALAQAGTQSSSLYPSTLPTYAEE